MFSRLGLVHETAAKDMNVVPFLTQLTYLTHRRNIFARGINRSFTPKYHYKIQLQFVLDSLGFSKNICSNIGA
jgi:hypothetical protein